MGERHWLLLLVGMGLAGCSLTPDLSLPEPPIPRQWPGEAGRATTEERPALPSWRTYYAHPVLQEMIDSALESSRDLRAALARMEKARALLGVAAVAGLPTLQGEAAHQTVRTPGDLSATGRGTLGHRADIGLSVPAFDVDFWGRLRGQEEAAVATVLASEESAMALRILLIAQVVEACITWRELSERLVLAQDLLENRRAGRAIAAQKRDAGVATAQASRLAEVAVETARDERAELQRQVALAQNAIQLLLGKSLDQGRSWPGLEELTMTADLPVNLPAQVMAARPDVRAAEQRLRGAQADIGAARAAFWPRIVLTGTAGTASQELSGLFQPGSAVWSFMPRLDLPIFDLSRRQNTLSAVTAERNALLAEYEKSVQQAFREVADALVSRGVWQERLQAATATQAAQQARLQLLQSRFRAGVDGRAALLEGEHALLASRQMLRSVQRMGLLNRVWLYKALGGGVE